jgi:hypothetical protein
MGIIGMKRVWPSDAMSQNPRPGAAAPYDSIMMYCANIYDAGVVVLPTHRLVQYMPVPHMAARLSRCPDTDGRALPVRCQ